MNKKAEWKNVPISTYIRLGITLVLIINYVLTALGINPLPVDANKVVNVTTVIITVVSILYSIWKNNSITNVAQCADKVLEILNNKGLSKEEQEKVLSSSISDIIATVVSENPELSEEEITELIKKQLQENKKTSE